MKLGGFVLFRDNAATIDACLSSLIAVCDDVIAVDTGSQDGSRGKVDAAGIRTVEMPWSGYGNARALAASALQHCDYTFYLDSDERMEGNSLDALRSAMKQGLTRASYRVTLRDWDLVGNYVYRHGTRHRLVRADCARWRPEMIVHESLELPRTELLPVTIDHAFLRRGDERSLKEDRYGFLWALRAYCQGKRAKNPTIERWAIMVRDLFFKGALWRGGTDALRAAAQTSRYHSAKHAYLRRFQAGQFSSAVDAYASGRWEELFSGIVPSLLR